MEHEVCPRVISERAHDEPWDYKLSLGTSNGAWDGPRGGQRAPRCPKDPSRFPERPKQLQGDSRVVPRGSQDNLRVDQTRPKGTQGEPKERQKVVNAEAHEMNKLKN